MKTVQYIVFLCLLLLFSQPVLVAIYRVDIITLKDDRKIILFGDAHDIGTREENVYQAYLFYDLIEKFSKNHPNESIVMLPEMLIYAPEGLSKKDIELMITNEQLNDFYQILRGGKIGQELVIELFNTQYTTWLHFTSPLLLPMLYKLSSITNLSIIPTDPRHAIFGNVNFNHSIFDVGGFPSSFTNRYWLDGWKDNVNQEYHSYFKSHFTNLPRHYISSLLLNISNITKINEDNIFTTPWNNLDLSSKKQIFKDKKDMFNMIADSMNTLLDSEMLYNIIKKDSGKYIFGTIGGKHNERIIKTLNDLNIIKEIKSQTFNAQNWSRALGVEIMEFAAHDLGITLANNNYISDFLVYIENSYKAYDNNHFQNISQMITKFYKENKNPRDTSGYSLLSYLVCYQASFFDEDYMYLNEVSSIAHRFIETALQAGADPNAIEPDGKTPLVRVLYHMILDSGDNFNEYQEVLRILIKYGANPYNSAVFILLRDLEIKIPQQSYSSIRDILYKG